MSIRKHSQELRIMGQNPYLSLTHADAVPVTGTSYGTFFTSGTTFGSNGLYYNDSISQYYINAHTDFQYNTGVTEMDAGGLSADTKFLVYDTSNDNYKKIDNSILFGNYYTITQTDGLLDGKINTGVTLETYSGITGDITESGSDLTISIGHNVNGALSVTSSPNTYIDGLTIDSNGHITATSTGSTDFTDVLSLSGLTDVSDSLINTEGYMLHYTGGQWASFSGTTIQGTGVLSGTGNISDGGTISITHDTGLTDTVVNTGAQFIQSIGIDEYGHISGITTGTAIIGSGTTDYVPVWNGTNSLTDSSTLWFDGSGQFNIENDVKILGDFFVSGTTTTIHTDELNVTDPVIVIASGQSSGMLDAGIIVDRGSEDNAAFIWDEPFERFVFANCTGLTSVGGHIEYEGLLPVHVGSLTVTGKSYLQEVTGETGSVIGSTQFLVSSTAGEVKYFDADAIKTYMAMTGFYSWDIAANDGTSSEVGSGTTISFNANSPLSVSHDSDTAITFTHNAPGIISGGSSGAFDGTVVTYTTSDAYRHLTTVESVDLDTYYTRTTDNYWIISDGTNTTNIYSTGETATFVGGTGIGVVESNGTVTISFTGDTEDNYVTGGTFNTSDGNLTLWRNDAAVSDINFDGRYLSGITTSATNGLNISETIINNATSTLTIGIDANSIENDRLVNSGFTIVGDTGTDFVNLGETLNVVGGTGVNVAITDNTVTINSDDASTQNSLANADIIITDNTTWTSIIVDYVMSGASMQEGEIRILRDDATSNPVWTHNYQNNDDAMTNWDITSISETGGCTISPSYAAADSFRWIYRMIQ